jgi:hypothetical protein
MYRRRDGWNIRETRTTQNGFIKQGLIRWQMAKRVL